MVDLDLMPTWSLTAMASLVVVDLDIGGFTTFFATGPFGVRGRMSVELDLGAYPALAKFPFEVVVENALRPMTGRAEPFSVSLTAASGAVAPFRAVLHNDESGQIQASSEWVEPIFESHLYQNGTATDSTW